MRAGFVPRLQSAGSLAALIYSLWLSSAYAGTDTVVIAVDPQLPSTYEITRIRLEGGLYSGCAPQLLNLETEGQEIVATYHQPSTVCPDSFFLWDEQFELGLLSAGTYRVSVYLLSPGRTAPSLGLVAQAEFDVAERVGVSSHGFLTSRAVCRNRSTGQRVVIRGSAAVANCESSGLSIRPGDRITVRVLGRFSAE